jgi:hypothetical protein
MVVGEPTPGSQGSTAVEPSCGGSTGLVLPPGPRLPATAQATMRVWRYPQFSDRNHARFGDTFSVRVGALPVSVLTKDRDAIRRLFW